MAYFTVTRNIYSYNVLNDENWEAEEGVYFKGLVKDLNGKNCKVYKTFGEAAKKCKELHTATGISYHITQTHTGFQLRNGKEHIECGEHKLGLVSYIYVGVWEDEYWCERESEGVKSNCGSV